MLLALIGIVSGIYYLVIGLPIMYVMLKRKSISRVHFIIAGVLASVPMLVVSLTSREPEWIIGTLVAGFVGGLVFAIRLPSEQHT